MPDTLTPYELDAIRQRDQNAKHPGKTWLVQDRRALLAHIDALTAAVEALPLYDENARTMADAAESMRNRAVAILRGEQRVHPPGPKREFVNDTENCEHMIPASECRIVGCRGVR